MASNMIANGATSEQVAYILGNTPAIVHKHYFRATPRFRDNLDRVVEEATKERIIEEVKPALEQIETDGRVM